MLLPCPSSAAMNQLYGLILVRRVLYTFWAIVVLSSSVSVCQEEVFASEALSDMAAVGSHSERTVSI